MLEGKETPLEEKCRRRHGQGKGELGLGKGNLTDRALRSVRETQKGGKGEKLNRLL